MRCYMATLGAPPDPIAVLRAHRSSVNAVAFHQSANHLLSGDSEGELKIWDVARRRVRSSFRAHSPKAGIIGIGTTGTLGDTVLSQGRDGTVKCWQLLDEGFSREPLMEIRTNAYQFCKLSPLLSSTIPGIVEAGEADSESASQAIPAQRLVAIAGEEPSTAEIWDVDQGALVQRLDKLPGTKSAGMCMSLQLFIPPGMPSAINLLIGYEDGSMALWDIKATKAPRFTTRFHEEPGGISGAADVKTVFFTMDHASKKSCSMSTEVKTPRPGIGDIAIRPDGKIAATGGWDQRVRIYDYHRRRPLAVLAYHSAEVTGVCFSSDSRLLASSSRDSCIALWSLYEPLLH